MIYMLIPFVIFKVDTERGEYLATLTDDYAEQFNDVKYAYPTGSEVIPRRAHYAGSVGWIYTKVQPETFNLYGEERIK